MSVVVTGATGRLGQHVVRHLLARGVDPSEVVAGGRDRDRLAELEALGVHAAVMDYEETTTLDAAIQEGDRLLLVSGSEVGQRVPQHQAVIDAAVDAGVELLAYTSILDAGDSPMRIAREHRATEEALAAADVPVVLLRNGWYTENYADQLETYRATGTVLGATGEGRIAAATRSDLAEAAAVVLAGEGHAGRTYELGGPSFTLGEVAALVREVTGEDVQHVDVPTEQLQAALVEAGLPEDAAAMLADADAGIREGWLDTSSSDLVDLIGHAPTTLADQLRARVG